MQPFPFRPSMTVKVGRHFPPRMMLEVQHMACEGGALSNFNQRADEGGEPQRVCSPQLAPTACHTTIFVAQSAKSRRLSAYASRVGVHQLRGEGGGGGAREALALQKGIHVDSRHANHRATRRTGRRRGRQSHHRSRSRRGTSQLLYFRKAQMADSGLLFRHQGKLQVTAKGRAVQGFVHSACSLQKRPIHSVSEGNLH